jgi:hypothetical protein
MKLVLFGDVTPASPLDMLKVKVTLGQTVKVCCLSNRASCMGMGGQSHAQAAVPPGMTWYPL